MLHGSCTLCKARVDVSLVCPTPWKPCHRSRRPLTAAVQGDRPGVDVANQKLLAPSLLQELRTGQLLSEAKAAFPKVTWGPNELARVLASGVTLALAAAAATSTHLLPSTTNSTPSASIGAAAQQHLLQELGLLLAFTAVLQLCLGSSRPRQQGHFAWSWDPQWAQVTLATCAVVFPLVDPLLYSAWGPAATALLGSGPSPAYVDTLQQAAAAGDMQALAEHALASCCLGPLWEELFWRGFFLASLTKVLPLPACVALSSANFAALHLSPHSLLPLLLLSACCDMLYLRSGANLLPPLMFHALWNSYQLAAIVALGKHSFV